MHITDITNEIESQLAERYDDYRHNYDEHTDATPFVGYETFRGAKLRELAHHLACRVGQHHYIDALEALGYEVKRIREP